MVRVLPKKLGAAVLAVGLAIGGPGYQALAADTVTADEAVAKQAYAIGVQAYIWGYPMVVMQKSRDAMT